MLLLLQAVILISGLWENKAIVDDKPNQNKIIQTLFDFSFNMTFTQHDHRKYDDIIKFQQIKITNTITITRKRA